MKRIGMTGFIVSAVAVCLLSVALVNAATRTWTGSVDDDWFVAGNWEDGDSQPGVPEDTDTVIIPSGKSVLLTNETAALAAFSITNATLTFSNWTTRLRATTIDVWNNGNLTHSAINTNTAPGVTNRVCLVATDVTIRGGGKIEVNGRGFAALQGPGAGPDRQGGGYGGRGGSGGVSGGGGLAYGSTNAPTDPGSGGGVSAAGGLVWIEAPAGEVRIDGDIQANGITTTGRGAGSGGGIRIEARTIRGIGALSAVGGRGGTGGSRHGGGGGGRIALVFDAAAQAQVDPRPALTYSALGGLDSDTKRSVDGTLFVTDPVIFAPTVTVTAFLYSDAAAWTNDTLTFRQGDIVLPQGLALTVHGDLTVTNGVMRYRFDDAAPHSLNIGGNLILTNNSSLYLHAGATNGSSEIYGGLLDLGGQSVYLPSSCKLFLQSSVYDGGSIRIIAGSLTVAGEINADSCGYAPLYGPGRGGDKKSAGSYGGRGGSGGRDPYGFEFAPVQAGSGGGAGGTGGGLVWIEAPHGTIRIEGVILANGKRGDQGKGGGSGGGIVLVCQKFTVSGTLSADGGFGPDAGGGGGGRIAILKVGAERFARMIQGDTSGVLLLSDVPVEFEDSITVNGGAFSQLGSKGEDGTIVFGYQAGSMFMFR